MKKSYEEKLAEAKTQVSKVKLFYFLRKGLKNKNLTKLRLAILKELKLWKKLKSYHI